MRRRFAFFGWFDPHGQHPVEVITAMRTNLIYEIDALKIKKEVAKWCFGK
jgi:hypothetical protein